jgi:hypothetical protein
MDRAAGDHSAVSSASRVRSRRPPFLGQHACRIWSAGQMNTAAPISAAALRPSRCASRENCCAKVIWTSGSVPRVAGCCSRIGFTNGRLPAGIDGRSPAASAIWCAPRVFPRSRTRFSQPGDQRRREGSAFAGFWRCPKYRFQVMHLSRRPSCGLETKAELQAWGAHTGTHDVTLFPSLRVD